MSIWCSPDGTKIALLPYGGSNLIGSCRCCPCACCCCPELFTGNGFSGGPDMSITCVVNVGPSPVTGTISNTLNCGWTGFVNGFELPDQFGGTVTGISIDDLGTYMDDDGVCHWICVMRVGETYTVDIPMTGDVDCSCPEFDFVVDQEPFIGHEWTMALTCAPAMGMMEAPAQPRRTNLLAENQRRASLGLPPVQPKRKCCGRK